MRKLLVILLLLLSLPAAAMQVVTDNQGRQFELYPDGSYRELPPSSQARSMFIQPQSALGVDPYMKTPIDTLMGRGEFGDLVAVQGYVGGYHDEDRPPEIMLMFRDRLVAAPYIVLDLRLTARDVRERFIASCHDGCQITVRGQLRQRTVDTVSILAHQIGVSSYP